MADKLIELANRARTCSVVFADGGGDGRHPILTIQVQTPAIYHSAVRKSENRPPLNESLADKMRREAQKAAEAKAKAAKRQKTKQKAAS